MSNVKKIKNCYKILSCAGSYSQYNSSPPGDKYARWVVKYAGKFSVFCVCLSEKPDSRGEVEIADGQGDPDDPNIERRFHKTLRVYDEGLCQEACQGAPVECDFSGEYPIPAIGEGMSCRPGGKFSLLHAAFGVVRPGCGRHLRHAIEDEIENARTTGRCPDGLLSAISCKEVD